MNKSARGISGGMMIRLSVLLVVLVAVILIYYVETKAAKRFNNAFDSVAKEQPKDGPAVRELLGQDPEETKVVGDYYVEKYVFPRFFGDNYVYYAVYENKAEPRALTSHHKDELPFHMTSEKPNIAPAKAPEGAPEGQALGNPIGN